jgi:hypothetical protein
MVAGQLYDIRADLVQQFDIPGIAAEPQPNLARVGRRAIRSEGDFVAHMGKVCRTEQLADIPGRIGHTIALHGICRRPHKRSNACHD